MPKKKRNILYCRIIRSSIVKGRVKTIRLGSNFRHNVLIQADDLPTSCHILEYNIPLLNKDISYYGQPIALLLAYSQEELINSEKELHIEYEDFLISSHEATENSQLIHTFSETFGNPLQAWQETSKIFEMKHTIDTQVDLNRNTLCYTAYWGENTCLELSVPTIWTHLIAENLKGYISLNTLKILQQPLIYDELLLDGTLIALYVAHAALYSKKSISLILSSREQGLFSIRQPIMKLRSRVGLDKEEKVLVREIHVHVNTGAFPLFIEEIRKQLLSGLTISYQSPHWHITIDIYKSNLPPMTIVNDSLAMSIQIPMEVQTDHLIRLSKQNPLYWRKNNFFQSSSMPNTITWAERLDRLNAISDYTRKYAAYELLRKHNMKNTDSMVNISNKYSGIGLSCAFQPSIFSYGLVALELELDLVEYRSYVKHIWMIIDKPLFHTIERVRSSLEGNIIQCLEWVSGSERITCNNGKIVLQPNEYWRETHFTPQIDIDFFPVSGRHNSKGLRDILQTLIPSAYLNALSQASMTLFTHVPSDSREIFSNVTKHTKQE